MLRAFVQVHEAAASVPAAAAAGFAHDATAAPIVSNLDARVQQLMVSMLAVFQLAFRIPEGALKCWKDQQAGLRVSGSSTSADAAAAGPAQSADAASVQPGPHSSTSSSSSTKPVRWQHLLCLHPSHKLIAAYVNFTESCSHKVYGSVLCSCQVKLDAGSQWHSREDVWAAALSKEQLAEMRQLYQDALGFCRTFTALAPLPVVCNNPGCGELGGVSEAAAARYVCAGCGCRYCSAACQAAGWRSHKKGCRRMAAYGMRVEGQ
jgi:hypothetical protein